MMMNKKINFLITLIAILTLIACSSDDTPIVETPVIIGAEIFCPFDSTATVTTQREHDSYQWMIKAFNETAFNEIPGATSRDFSFIPFDLDQATLQVEIGEGSERVISETFKIDTYAFLPLAVSNSGSFESGRNGSIILCNPSDVLVLSILNGSEFTNIVWYKNSEPIADEDADILTINNTDDAPGIYTVRANPKICPNVILDLGVNITVVRCDN